MTLGSWALGFVRLGVSYRALIWKQLAFVARYAHQPISYLMTLPLQEVQELAEAVAELMNEESAQNRMITDE